MPEVISSQNVKSITKQNSLPIMTSSFSTSTTSCYRVVANPAIAQTEYNMTCLNMKAPVSFSTAQQYIKASSFIVQDYGFTRLFKIIIILQWVSIHQEDMITKTWQCSKKFTTWCRSVRIIFSR